MKVFLIIVGIIIFEKLLDLILEIINENHEKKKLQLDNQFLKSQLKMANEIIESNRRLMKKMLENGKSQYNPFSSAPKWAYGCEPKKEFGQDVVDAVHYAMKKSHPDNGGNAEDFMRFNKIYEELSRKG